MECPFDVYQKLKFIIKDDMAAEIVDASNAQPRLPQTWHFDAFQLQSALLDFLAGCYTWQYVVTFLLGVVVYDQGNQEGRVVVIDYFIQLTPSLVMYIKRKGPIAGPPFKIPLMGPFLQALHPKF